VFSLRRYFINKDDEKEFNNNKIIEKIMNKLSPEERSLVYYHQYKERFRVMVIGVLIGVIGCIAIGFELLYFSVV
jgi:hypothetical protein